MFDKFDDLLDGKIGKVVDEGNRGDFDCGDDEWVVVEGKKLYVGKEVCDIDEFDFNGGEVVLFKGDGYRGVCCYNGVVKKDGKWYWLDIMNDYMVYELGEEGEE